MTEFWQWLPGHGWPRLAFDVAWQGSLVGAVACVVLRPLVRRPAARAWLMLLALVLCLVAPLTSAAVRCGGYGWLRVTPADSVATPTPEAVEGATVLLPTLSDMTHDPAIAWTAEAIVRPRPTWEKIAVAAWAVISGLLAGRLLLSGWGVWRLAREAVSCRIAAILAAAANAARRVGLRRAPEVAHSRSVATPMVLAFGRPRLFIPPPGSEPGRMIDWYPVFCHELAHVRRGDGWGLLLARLITVLLPWQPVVWLLRRAYYRACEEACDDWAVSAGADPVELAAILSSLAPRNAPVPALGASGASSTGRRVKRLLALRSRPRPRVGLLWRLTTTAAALSIAVTVAAAQTQQSQPQSDGARAGAQQPAHSSETNAGALRRTGLKPYVIEPPDVIQIEMPQLVKLESYVIEPPDVLQIETLTHVLLPAYRIEAYDVLSINAAGTAPGFPIGPLDDEGEPTPNGGLYLVEVDGRVYFGPMYGWVKVVGLTLDEATEAIRKHLNKTLKDPVVSVQLARASGMQPVTGAYPVAPDGTVNLRQYGSVRVAGKTIAETKAALEQHLSQFFDSPKASVNVLAYNSKKYYIITQGAALGDNVQRVPITGKETVLDAMGRVDGPLRLGDKKISMNRKIWIRRRSADGKRVQTLPVDYDSITRRGSAATNYLLLPNDRVYIQEVRTTK